MRNALAIAWRDIRSMFVSPIAYVVLTGFVLLAGWFFFNLLAQFNRLVAAYSSVPGYDTTWLNLNDAVITPLLPSGAESFPTPRTPTSAFSARPHARFVVASSPIGRTGSLFR